VILQFPIPPGESFFRWTRTSILPENWVSWVSPNIWRDTVSKWTHRLLKEADNLGRSLYCACWGCYSRLSGGGEQAGNRIDFTRGNLARICKLDSASSILPILKLSCPSKLVISEKWKSRITLPVHNARGFFRMGRSVKSPRAWRCRKRARPCLKKSRGGFFN